MSRAINFSFLLVYRSFLPSVMSKMPSVWQKNLGILPILEERCLSGFP